MHVVDMTAADTLTMLDTEWTDYEDSIQNNAAQKIAADFIITGNIRDFTKSDIAVFTPQQFLELHS